MQTFRILFDAMASSCEVMLAAENESIARSMAQSAIDEVKRIEQKYSRYQPDSIVSRINAAAGSSWVECDEETIALLGYADTMFQTSDSLFDITSGVLRKAWDFRKPLVPTDNQLAPFRKLIGWQKVERKDMQILLPEAGMEIDFGGFGKEYAADRAANELASLGISHGYVNLAGDIRVVGPKPDGQPWMIGIQDPRDSNKIIATIPVVSGGLATSGDYERYFEVDGHRYCHIINPLTGQPVTHWRTVSVLAPLATMAGSISTIAMLKQDKGLAFLEGAGMDYFAIDHEGNFHQRTDSLNSGEQDEE